MPENKVRVILTTCSQCSPTEYQRYHKTVIVESIELLDMINDRWIVIAAESQNSKNKE